jgi:hypothetical protein
MKNKHKFRLAGAVLLAAFGLTANAQSVPCGTNLITNGDFEAGFTGFTSEYTYVANGPGNSEMIPERTIAVGSNAANYHPLFTGVGRSGNYLLVNGNTGTVRDVWTQNVNLTEGKEYFMQLYFQNLFPTAPASFIFKVTPNDLLTPAFEIGTYMLEPGINGWQEAIVSFTSTYTGSVKLSIINTNLTAYGNDFGIDDMSLTEVCIPCGKNQIVNGDFEGGNTGFTTGYAFKTDLPSVNNEMIPENTYGVDADIDAYHPLMVGVARSGNFLMVNGNTFTLKEVWGQDVNLNNGAEYVLTLYVQNIFNVAPADLRFNITPNDLLTPAFEIGSYTLAPGFNGWQEVTATFVSTYSGSAKLNIIDLNLTAFGNDFGIDDISFVETCPVECDNSNLIVNGDFEAGNSDFASEYTFTPDVAGNTEMIPPTYIAVGLDARDFHPQWVGVGRSGNYLLVNGNDRHPIRTIWAQNVNVVAGTAYNFTGYVQNLFPVSPGIVSFYAGSELVGTVVPSGLATYQEFSGIYTATADGSIELRIVTENFAFTGNDFGIDDLSFSAVCPNDEPCTPDGITASEVISFTQQLTATGTPITPARSNPALALGAPQGTDVINFVSLGFGGQIVLKFPVVINVNPAANELRVTETTFGSPACPSYPERAEFEGSLDGVTWTSLGEICLDGELNTDAAGPIQYLRITDISDVSAFSGVDDGYDVDGIETINSLCPKASSERARYADNVTSNEVTKLAVAPNPVNSTAIITIPTGDRDNTVTVTVNNINGQQVSTERFNVASSSVVNHVLDMSALSNGLYFVTVATNNGTEVIKVVKQ